MSACSRVVPWLSSPQHRDVFGCAAVRLLLLNRRTLIRLHLYSPSLCPSPRNQLIPSTLVGNYLKGGFSNPPTSVSNTSASLRSFIPTSLHFSLADHEPTSLFSHVFRSGWTPESRSPSTLLSSPIDSPYAASANRRAFPSNHLDTSCRRFQLTMDGWATRSATPTTTPSSPHAMFMPLPPRIRSRLRNRAASRARASTWPANTAVRGV